jgi:hypothetical protein
MEERLAMEIGDSNVDKFDGANQAEEALMRMMTSATSLELKHAFDDYLAILDTSGVTDLSTEKPPYLRKAAGTLAQGGAD